MSVDDDIFEQHRPALDRLAYRMLGSRADSDDVLQEAFLRWSRADRAEVHLPRAYLFSIVTRLCIDHRQAIEARRHEYVGSWLPEPIIEWDKSAPSDRVESAEAVSMAFMLVMESLSPDERAAYLLRRVFDFDYDEIASVIGKAEPTCRQLVSRAERRVIDRRPRYKPDPAAAERLTDAFLEACASGDLAGLVELLAADAVLYSDGGGKVAAALVPIRGADRIARFFLGILKKAPAELATHRVRVNGEPGLATVLDGQITGVLTLEVVDGRIVNCFVVRNPDKLSRVPAGKLPRGGGPV